MDNIALVLDCMFDLIKLVLVASCLYGAWYFGYCSGWKDCKQTKKRVRRERDKILKMY